MTITIDMTEILPKNSKKPPHTLGLYVHVPFCRSKCLYCDFTSLAARPIEELRRYVGALCAEIDEWGERLEKYSYALDTVYLGGGTPSILPIELIGQIMTSIWEKFSLADDTEITLECNPLTHIEDGEKYFLELRGLGINRLSIGIQSAHDAELKLIGRRHTFEQARRTFLDARAAGFDNISTDLMLALPSQTRESLGYSIDEILNLHPEHISIYSLQLEEGTPLCRFREKYDLPDDDTAADMYEIATARLREAGYEHYEISNFAADGRRSRHNMKYWRLDEYLGVGLAAHSDILGERRENTTDMEKYLGGDRTASAKTIGKAERELEFLMLGLRTADGISKSEFSERFGGDFDEKYGEIADKMQSGGFLENVGGRVRLTERGFEVSNSVLCELLNFDNIY